MLDVRHYVTRDGADVVAEWLRDLRDVQGKIAIIRRLNRIEQGNLGDSKFLRDGIHELRIDVGPGYRVYYARTGKQVILLLCGGSKRTQDADIMRAHAFWRDWSDRTDG
ncbi:type II toxin-antitoxin system RelE/ParE family toxin [Rhizobium sp. SL86]|uniref:type II toxin-antitoxin system RelE/ParE family toxin n=1 Tax=Rhizobium sp. SL86 TaxID=2995148 RepID=UPI002275D0C0|nr:type II toxin-antitoxin system RelE/ParE family toxin [Rhizobium sp. SL86]MCY1668190.1 type II toxin-antitoxin system RelE/ParE family toxin [Rhizobium sp. SL86]